MEIAQRFLRPSVKKASRGLAVQESNTANRLLLIRLLTTCGGHLGSLTILAIRQETAIVRILLVEDFAPYRSLVASMLDGNSECRVIGEASDGLEAVKKASEL